MKTPKGAVKSGRRSLKRYEITNLLFFLTVIVALGVLVSFVFHHYGTRYEKPPDNANAGVISESLTSHQYQSRLEIPVTDDGLIRGLFSLPGVESVTINQSVIIIRKSSSVQWNRIQPGVHQIVKEHLHIHY